MSVDCLRSCELGRDGDLGIDYLTALVRCEFYRYVDLSLGGGFGVRVLNVLSHLHERLVELLSEGPACQSFEVDLARYFLLLHGRVLLLNLSGASHVLQCGT